MNNNRNSNYSKRNYWLMFADSIIFINAMTMLSVNVVIPYFLNSLGAGVFHVSLASALVSIGAFISQPIFSKMALEAKSKLWTFIKILSVQRFFFLAFVLTIPMLATKAPGTTATLFLICWAIFSFFTGSYQPFYWSLFPKMIPEEKRGRLLGFSNSAAYLVSLGTSVAVSFILEKVPYPYNYTLVFALGILLLLLDNLDFCLMKEPEDMEMVTGYSYMEYLKAIPGIFKSNKQFVKLVSGYTLLVISNISLSFYTLFAIRKYSADEGQLAVFMVITACVSILGSAVFGIIAGRFGYRKVLIIASVCGGLAGATILGFHSIYAVFIAFAFSSLCLCGYQLSNSALIAEISQPRDIPVLIGVNTMITLATSTLTTLASSFIINTFSFSPVFLLTGLSSFCAFGIFRLVARKDVRSQKTEARAETL